MYAWRSAVVGVMLALSLTSCVTPPEHKDLRWYQQRAEQNPDNQVYRMELQHVLFLREQAIQKQVQEFLNLGLFGEAHLVVQAGLEEMPDSLVLQELNQQVTNRLQSKERYDEAIFLSQNGQVDEAKRLLQEAIQLDPANDAAADLLKKLRKRALPTYKSDPIQLRFDKLDLKSAIEFIANSYGVSVIFDDGVKEMPISMSIDTLNFYDALQIVLQMSKNHFKVIDERTIVVYPDSKDKRSQYENLVLKVIPLQHINAKDMAAILKSMLDMKDISVNDRGNLLMLRDTAHLIGLAEQLVMINDVPAPQVLLDVEILEINKSKSKQVGTDFGSYRVELRTEAIPLNQSILDSLNESSQLTIPTIGLKAFKQDVDAKLLANPKIRVLNLEEAKIHIGDRVPLRSASILDATGQTRTTFEYQEIGIKLSVKPSIHPNNNTTLKLALEVSALGENVGTIDEPAYRIGARNAETTMLLKDGESVLLGGLIREQERRAFSSLPGVVRESSFARLFGFDDQEEGRTDVLLTITPRVIRNNRNNEAIQELEMSMGTRDRLMAPTHDPLYNLKVGEPTFKSLEEVQEDKQLALVGAEPKGMAHTEAQIELVKASLGDEVNLKSEILMASADTTAASNIAPSIPDVSAESPILSVMPELQTVSVEDTLTLKLGISELAGFSGLENSLLFNPNLLRFIEVRPVKPYVLEVHAELTDGGNAVKLSASFPQELKPVQDVNLVEVVFKAIGKGTSFIVVKTPLLTENDGQRRGAISRNARIVVE